MSTSSLEFLKILKRLVSHKQLAFSYLFRIVLFHRIFICALILQIRVLSSMVAINGFVSVRGRADSESSHFNSFNSLQEDEGSALSHLVQLHLLCHQASHLTPLCKRECKRPSINRGTFIRPPRQPASLNFYFMP